MNELTNSTVRMTPASVVITRTFAAPRQLVFDAWTKPEHLAQWYAPKGFTTEIRALELRPGGIFHYCMRSPEGAEVWGLGVYEEIVPPERIVYADSFADADGNRMPPTAYGCSPSYPATTTVTITFAESGAGTTVTLEHAIPETASERKGVGTGWSEMLDALEEHLAEKAEF